MDTSNNSIESQYSGSYGGLLGRVVLFLLISVGSIGIAVPWAIALVHRWVISNVKISKKKLIFRGTGKQIFPVWIAAWLAGLAGIAIIAITASSVVDPIMWHEHGAFDKGHIPPSLMSVTMIVGIMFVAMFVWITLKITRILAANTHFEGSEGEGSSFGSSYWQFFGKNIALCFRLAITIGIGLPWALSHYLRWWTGELKIDNTALDYAAQPSFLKRWIPYWVIAVVIDILQEITEKLSCRYGDYASGCSEHVGRGAEAVAGAGRAFAALNGFFGLADFFLQVLITTMVYRWIVARLTTKQ